MDLLQKSSVNSRLGILPYNDIGLGNTFLLCHFLHPMSTLRLSRASVRGLLRIDPERLLIPLSGAGFESRRRANQPKYYFDSKKNTHLLGAEKGNKNIHHVDHTNWNSSDVKTLFM
jgi:hypothetical protein